MFKKNANESRLEVSAALAIAKDSENLIMSLNVSISSLSTETCEVQKGLLQYIRTSKRRLYLKLLLLAWKAAWTKAVSIILSCIW
ncbi:hypothetical protein HRM2_19190 [Desulforapulum autotrophicum HRM2]|uniref:Uncharacterized protein n=1 Tax=Desulforapulum autotrophicum (strain ATCC 43914 / DSM 3382 / VKM B-1955 / HRM2) TaxID=177437 RepID=C0QC08_DESAH|nr:hypothetical protein HRM2_19190 [Desulforapulum autotrophicum HRM2]